MSEVFDRIAAIGVIPVIAIERTEHALPLADALLAGGLEVAEITFRTRAAAEVIARLARERPRLLTGAGTVLTPAQVAQATEAGARFGLAPGFDPAIVAEARARNLPFAPGVMTPSELSLAAAQGCRLMKFFPAMAAGGPAMLKNVGAPFRHLELRFIPTGGVTLENMADWLALPEVAAVGGTWIARAEDMRAGDWAGISERARAAVARVRESRQQA